MNKPTPKFFATAKQFRQWLEANAATTTELTVGFWKVDSGHPSMTWSEAVDQALCFGWIDGVRRRIDDESYEIRFTPRRAGSIWSKVNIAKLEQLRLAGQMTKAGEDAFARRQEAKSGIYSYEQAESSELTEDERKRFQKIKSAWTYFESCPPGYRRTIIHWITTAKKPETRSQRLEKLIQACQNHERLK
jgi:uncharacterized protein YdeI (YjbR/CyaY-like superfamily)